MGKVFRSNGTECLVLVHTLLVLFICGCSGSEEITCRTKITANNMEKVFNACSKKAEEGEVQAQYRVAGMFLVGNGIERSKEKAIYWASLAAKKNHIKAMGMLASLYSDNLETSTQAIEWYTRAAEAGETFSQSELGRIYFQGKITPQDSEKGIYWYTKAAESGDIFIIKTIAHHYHTGDGILQNSEKAIYWYKKAIENGDVDSMLSIGEMYLFGDGISQNLEIGYAWLNLANKYGNSYAKGYLETLEKELAPNSILFAKKLSQQLETTYVK